VIDLVLFIGRILLVAALYLFLFREVENEAFLAFQSSIDGVQEQDNNHREMKYHGEIKSCSVVLVH
jgi:hypothetical protein